MSLEPCIKSDNLQHNMLVCWNKWSFDQASDVPSFFVSFFYKFTKKKIKKINAWNIRRMVGKSFVPTNHQTSENCRIYGPSNFHIDIFVMLVLQCCSAERTKQARADPLYLEEDTEHQKREWRKTIWLPLNICTLIFEDVKFLRILCRNKFLLNLMNHIA